MKFSLSSFRLSFSLTWIIVFCEFVFSASSFSNEILVLDAFRCPKKILKELRYVNAKSDKRNGCLAKGDDLHGDLLLKQLDRDLLAIADKTKTKTSLFLFNPFDQNGFFDRSKVRDLISVLKTKRFPIIFSAIGIPFELLKGSGVRLKSLNDLTENRVVIAATPAVKRGYNGEQRLFPQDLIFPDQDEMELRNTGNIGSLGDAPDKKRTRKFGASNTSLKSNILLVAHFFPSQVQIWPRGGQSGLPRGYFDSSLVKRFWHQVDFFVGRMPSTPENPAHKVGNQQGKSASNKLADSSQFFDRSRKIHQGKLKPSQELLTGSSWAAGKALAVLLGAGPKNIGLLNTCFSERPNRDLGIGLTVDKSFKSAKEANQCKKAILRNLQSLKTKHSMSRDFRWAGPKKFLKDLKGTPETTFRALIVH